MIDQHFLYPNHVVPATELVAVLVKATDMLVALVGVNIDRQFHAVGIVCPAP